jgi:hypothetical protein
MEQIFDILFYDAKEKEIEKIRTLVTKCQNFKEFLDILCQYGGPEGCFEVLSKLTNQGVSFDQMKRDVLQYIEKAKEKAKRLASLQFVYSVFIRSRSKQLEQFLQEKGYDQNSICQHDNIEIVFQSADLDKAIEYFNRYSPRNTKSWKTMNKMIIRTPLDIANEDYKEEGFINLKCIEYVSYN